MTTTIMMAVTTTTTALQLVSDECAQSEEDTEQEATTTTTLRCGESFQHSRMISGFGFTPGLILKACHFAYPISGCDFRKLEMHWSGKL